MSLHGRKIITCYREPSAPFQCPTKSDKIINDGRGESYRLCTREDYEECSESCDNYRIICNRVDESKLAKPCWKIVDDIEMFLDAEFDRAKEVELWKMLKEHITKIIEEV